MSLEACLPADLRGPTTTIAKVASGLSGAGVYRVEAGGAAYVLKVWDEDQPLTGWRQKLQVHRLAADAGLAPKVVHVDEERRAVVSAFVLDRSFPSFYGDPRTRPAALSVLGRTIRRLHDLPVPPNTDSRDPREFLATISSSLAAFPLPAFATEAVQRVLAETPPVRDRVPVLSHNDVNPTNLVFDGENVLLLDWDTAGANDPYYDLAAIAVFLRMDEAACTALLTAYEGAPIDTIPARLGYNRRLVAALCGCASLRLAQQRGHAGATGAETLDTTVSLSEFYQRLRSGSVSLATADGHWGFGLALVKASGLL